MLLGIGEFPHPKSPVVVELTLGDFIIRPVPLAVERPVSGVAWTGPLFAQASFAPQASEAESPANVVWEAGADDWITP